jgi:hypothetical protein
MFSGQCVPINGVFELKNNRSSNLTLSHNLREAKYKADGSGRDGHIHFSNGGLNFEYKPKTNIGPSGRFVSQASPKYGTGGQEFAMPVHYKSDGSGRDSYVKMTNGGFTSPSKP